MERLNGSRTLEEIIARAMEKVEEPPYFQENSQRLNGSDGKKANECELRKRKTSPLDVLFERVPEKYRYADIANVPQLSGFEPDGTNGVFFQGITGSGKTYAATALARSMISSLQTKVNPANGDPYYERNILQWHSTPYLLMRIRATYGNKSDETEKQIVDMLTTCGILVLDEIGAEKTSDFTGATLYTILSGRDNENRMTIITTNQTLQMIDSWEPRIASRLGGMQSISLPNIDRRIKK